MALHSQAAFVLYVLITLCIPVPITFADDPAPTGNQDLGKEQLKRWTKFYQREASRYEIFLGGDGGEKLQFHEQPVFRWASPETQNEFNGVIYVWTRDGRPEALGSIWSVASKQVKGRLNIAHTFHSLAQQPLLANREGEAFWYPTEPGLSFKRIPDAPAPAQSPAHRRVQIRALSREFSAIQDAKGKQETLQILPRPIYEYETGQGSGAIFAFLREWDPEVMLIIEARETAEGPRWHFEALRFCMLSARVQHRNLDVWNYERGGPMRDPKHYYFSMHGASWADRIIEDE